MRRTLSIASLDMDSTLDEATLERFARVEPTNILVFSTFEDQPTAIGQCTRLWLSGRDLWAEMEIRDDALWADADNPTELPHAESIITLGEQVSLMAVVVTSLPRGQLAALFQGALQHLGVFRFTN